MIFTPTPLEGAYVIDPEPIEDGRGFFARVWCEEEAAEYGLQSDFCQANTNFNQHKGTLRGMHFQRVPHQEVKVVRCTRGGIYDVIIDLRTDSPTFTHHFGVKLSEHNHMMLYVPEGFAHGYQTLVDNTEVFYPVTAPYTPDAEGGVRYNDPTFGIDWPLPVTRISDKDQSWPNFEPATYREQHSS